MDYLQSGPKLRKWYGETEKLTGPRKRPRGDDQGRQGGDDEDGGEGGEGGARDAVLVTDADSPLGELVVLQLVLARCVTEWIAARACL